MHSWWQVIGDVSRITDGGENLVTAQVVSLLNDLDKVPCADRPDDGGDIDTGTGKTRLAESDARVHHEAVDDAAPVLTFEELADAVRRAPSPADDVSITWDGRRLDSKEKVLRFLAELEVARKNGLAVGPPLS
jgi:hypothetical protein